MKILSPVNQRKQVIVQETSLHPKQREMQINISHLKAWEAGRLIRMLPIMLLPRLCIEAGPEGVYLKTEYTKEV